MDYTVTYSKKKIETKFIAELTAGDQSDAKTAVWVSFYELAFIHQTEKDKQCWSYTLTLGSPRIYHWNRK